MKVHSGTACWTCHSSPAPAPLKKIFYFIWKKTARPNSDESACGLLSCNLAWEMAFKVWEKFGDFEVKALCKPCECLMLEPSSPEQWCWSQIQYRIALICFHIVSGTAAQCLSELLHLYSPSRSLRSASNVLRSQDGQEDHVGYILSIRRTCDLEISSSLCQASSFKSKPKTHLFSFAYWYVIFFLPILPTHHQ